MPASRQEVVAALQGALRQGAKSFGNDFVASGSRALDAELGGGFRRGSLVEWLAAEGSGAATLAIIAAQRAAQGFGVTQGSQAIVIVDRQQQFYPPAAAALGLVLSRTIVARPTTKRDQDWTLTQALRCPAVAAVLCWPDRFDDRAFRRWQLAAEAGRSLGLIVRSESARHEPSWAEVRLLVVPVVGGERRRFRLEILRSPTGGARTMEAKSLEVELSEEGLLHDANTLSPPSQLASSTPVQRSSRA
ncbi:ImuA family protein [Anatilimnocola aggregata]|uniref:ImuA family protein n=1 Tax=Anatilimnocola aggregata TaxID=2528021 RepID=UPI00192E71E3|nr:hypothetical protein [Anatilimnocola aggregata]